MDSGFRRNDASFASVSKRVFVGLTRTGAVARVAQKGSINQVNRWLRDLIEEEEIEGDSVAIDSLFVPLDGSEWHERAISYGLLMSKWFGSKIDLFFSLAEVPPLTRHGEWRQRALLSLDVPGNELADDSILTRGAIHEYGRILADGYLKEITDRLEDLGIEIATDLSAGSPAHILTHKAQEHENSIIVMYARPQHRLRRYVRKKMAEELLSVTTVPILMINDDHDAGVISKDPEPTSLIVPLRVESPMRACLPYAISIARKAGVGIRLLESNVEYRRNRPHFDRSREFSLEFLDQSEVDYAIQASDYGISESVTRAHRASPFSWIVMGSRLRHGFSRRFLPSVADNIRREVTCPILAVPQREVIAVRRDRLHDWTVDFLAHQDPADVMDPRTPTSSRTRNWARQIASRYTFNDPKRRRRSDQDDS